MAENKKDPTDIMTCYFVHTNLIGKVRLNFILKTSDSATILNGIHEITHGLHCQIS